MTESSRAVSPMRHLAPLADWVDLDCNLLIKIDVYKGLQNYATAIDWENLFSLFHGKREF